MFTDEFRFKSSSGIDLAARIYRKSNNYKDGIIFSHGLFSSKDGYKIIRMAESIADTGFVLMTFDFRFAGENSDRISDILIMEEVEDLRHAIEHFRSLGVERLHLMGSSLGAAVSVLCASENIYNVESLILIATPLEFSGIFPWINPGEVKDLDENASFDVAGIKLKHRFLKELFGLDMIRAVKKIKCPALLIHGGMDQVVAVSNVETYLKNSSSSCSEFIINDGDHHLTRDSDIDLISGKVAWWLGKYRL